MAFCVPSTLAYTSHLKSQVQSRDCQATAAQTISKQMLGRLSYRLEELEYRVCRHIAPTIVIPSPLLSEARIDAADVADQAYDQAQLIEVIHVNKSANTAIMIEFRREKDALLMQSPGGCCRRPGLTVQEVESESGKDVISQWQLFRRLNATFSFELSPF